MISVLNMLINIRHTNILFSMLYIYPLNSKQYISNNILIAPLLERYCNDILY